MPLQQSKVTAEPTKEELLKEAQALDIEGRSTMTKAELEEAVVPNAEVDKALAAIDEMWRTVGFDTVNDQPVKAPTAQEMEQLAAMLQKAAAALKVARKHKG